MQKGSSFPFPGSANVPLQRLTLQSEEASKETCSGYCKLFW